MKNPLQDRNTCYKLQTSVTWQFANLNQFWHDQNQISISQTKFDSPKIYTLYWMAIPLFLKKNMLQAKTVTLPFIVTWPVSLIQLLCNGWPTVCSFISQKWPTILLWCNSIWPPSFFLSPQVLAPNDVQFALTESDKEEVVINTSTSISEAVCIDTPAFVGVAISFVMILVRYF